MCLGDLGAGGFVHLGVLDFGSLSSWGLGGLQIPGIWGPWGLEHIGSLTGLGSGSPAAASAASSMEERELWAPLTPTLAEESQKLLESTSSYSLCCLPDTE